MIIFMTLNLYFKFNSLNVIIIMEATNFLVDPYY